MRSSHKVGAAFLDDVDHAALTDFAKQYGDVRLGPVSIVIAAYNEADNIGAVLDGLPTAVCGLPAHTIVVDDGSADDTAAIAKAHGAYVCRPSTNRGQGAAL